MKLRLSDADRERLGCPEFLPVDHRSITNREAVALQKLGYPTPFLFAQALQSDPPDYEAWTALVWLALRRAGVEVDAQTLEFDTVHLRVLGDDEVEPKAPAGKATAREGSTSSRAKTSTGTATSKARSSRTSSRS